MNTTILQLMPILRRHGRWRRMVPEYDRSTMTKSLEPSCAGTFFPGRRGEATECRCAVRCAEPHRHRVARRQLLYRTLVTTTQDRSRRPAMPAWLARLSTIRRVLLLGTFHMARRAGLVTTAADAFVTPLGKVPIDKAAVEQAARLPQVSMDDAVRRNADIPCGDILGRCGPSKIRAVRPGCRRTSQQRRRGEQQPMHRHAPTRRLRIHPSW